MSAAIAYRAPLPLYEEGLAFWEELERESQQHVKNINGVATAHGLEDFHLVEWKSGRGIIGIVRKWYPSTDITISLAFERWGPVIKVLVTGYQHEDLRFYPEEQEVPVARDLDGRTVAVLGEGRSYSPREFACYLAQHLRRCFPDMALPCTPDDCG
jgi:hypothetical protein